VCGIVKNDINVINEKSDDSARPPREGRDEYRSSDRVCAVGWFRMLLG